MNPTFEYDKQINHLEIAKIYGGFEIRKFHNDDYLDKETVEGLSIDGIVMNLSDRGWSTRINRDKVTAKATIGAPARIDMQIKTGNVATIRVFADGWTAATKPMRMTEKVVDLAQEAEDLECRGWIVLMWDWHDSKGLRAWRSNNPLPVRTGYGIQNLRSRLEHCQLSDLERLQLKRLDLAFVL